MDLSEDILRWQLERIFRSGTSLPYKPLMMELVRVTGQGQAKAKIRIGKAKKLGYILSTGTQRSNFLYWPNREILKGIAEKKQIIEPTLPF